MLMAAAAHLGGGSAAHSSSSSPISPPTPPWRPVVLVPHQHHQAAYDQDLIITPSSSPSPTTPTTCPQRQRLRPASCSRRAGKPQRRPRPSRKLPTTYISADAASFRRMVHQVTGADDNVVLHQATADQELLCRPPPSRAALTPTLDTSAFLLGAARGAGAGGGATPTRPTGAPCLHGSAAGDPGAALQAEATSGRGGVRGGEMEYGCSNGSAAGGGGGLPSLESSWQA